MQDDYQRKLKKLSLLKEQKLLKDNLPHIYGHKFYPWMRQYFDSHNKIQLICSANQIGKSSIQIRKCINWATSLRLAKELWPHLAPRQFWYLYPSSYVATIEFEKKWTPEFLPRKELRNHPLYGWRADYRSKYIQALHFNSGISVYFKTYSQDPQDLQSGTVDAVFTDEELPMELFPELQARLFASDGYFSSVFTPTLGQEFWREAVESNKRFPDALKLNVSMYDCLKYEDGTPSHWTADRIQKIINSCKSDAEVQRRVYGKFVLDSGLKYQAFNPAVNIMEPQKIPNEWLIYCGVDSGTGGKFNHPSAYVFVAMRPDFQLGWIFAGRRFDGIPTTNSDLVAMVRDRCRELKVTPTQVFYDYAATDLATIAYQMGETWVPAEKSHLIGEQFINVGFKNKMLQIFNTEELAPLVAELKSLKLSTPKNQAHDDYCFVAGTKITVPGGEKNIEDLVVGDFVLTRKGSRRVVAVGNREERVNRIFLNNGVCIKCTPDHPFYTGVAFKKCSTLTRSDTLLTFSQWQSQNQSLTKASFLGGIQKQGKRLTGIIIPQMARIVKTVFCGYIKKYGKIVTDQYLRGMQSTTEMGIRRTIPYPILNAWSAVSTNQIISRRITEKIQANEKNGLVTLECTQPSGTVQKKGSCFIESLASFLGGVERSTVNAAKFVKSLFGQGILKKPLGFVVGHVKPGRLGRDVVVIQNQGFGSARVYNLTVEDAHEYFANGILVSNCDAMRYAITKVPWDWSCISDKPTIAPERVLTETELRRNFVLEKPPEITDINEEIEAWNELLSDYGYST